MRTIITILLCFFAVFSVKSQNKNESVSKINAYVNHIDSLVSCCNSGLVYLSSSIVGIRGAQIGFEASYYSEKFNSDIGGASLEEYEERYKEYEKKLFLHHKYWNDKPHFTNGQAPSDIRYQEDIKNYYQNGELTACRRKVSIRNDQDNQTDLLYEFVCYFEDGKVIYLEKEGEITDEEIKSILRNDYKIKF